MTIHQFADKLISYCYAVQGSVTSWGRTRKRNAEKGGVLDSSHRLWLGADVVLDDNAITIAERELIAKRLGLTLIVEGNHDHLQGG